jgi:hypothetical protein
MSVKNRKRRLQSAQPAVSENSPRHYRWLYPLALGSLVAGILVFAFSAAYHTPAGGSAAASNQLSANVGKQAYPTLGELSEMSADELRGQDIALSVVPNSAVVKRMS